MPSQWPETASQAIALQQELCHQVRLDDANGPIETLAGIDVGYDKKRNLARAVAVVMQWPCCRLQHSVIAYAIPPLDYIPGLLSFREMPAILQALDILPVRPELLMVDGQGIAHPRRLGIAAHLGAYLDMPSIGVAKSRLSGTYNEPDNEAGSISALLDNGEILGYVMRSRAACKPLFVSPGHRISHDSALAWASAMCAGYRLPEPTRLADKLSKSTTFFHSS